MLSRRGMSLSLARKRLIAMYIKGRARKTDRDSEHKEGVDENMRGVRMEGRASGSARLVEVMRLCIYPGLTYDRPSATFLLTM